MSTLLADTLGNIWFGLMLVGAVGWAAVVGHMMGFWDLPKMRK